MTIREQSELNEEKFLLKYAAKAKNSERKKIEEKCSFRTDFQRDRDRIVHCKAFRRLKHKTQVYIAPHDDHYRTRLTHSLEVAQIGRTIARGLRLNEDLVEAIALGHDVGHTPFGHVGEKALQSIRKARHFKHNEQSVRVLNVIEREGKGLNLTQEVTDGILNHTGDNYPATLEGKIVKIADRIAYLCHDYDDAVRAGILKFDELPKKVIKTFGIDHSAMITVMVRDIIENSLNKNNIIQSKEIKNTMCKFRRFLFDKVYESIRLEEERLKASNIVKKLYNHYLTNPNLLPSDFFNYLKDSELEQIVTDYIAGLTDNYAINLFQKL